jgi:hypothetical protein
MANITATQFEIYRSMYGGKLDRFEQRASNYGALRAAQGMSAPGDPRSLWTQEDVNNIANSFGINVQIPVVDLFSPTITSGTARTCSFATEGAVSKLVTLTFVTYGFGFVMAPQDHFNNKVQYDDLLNKQLDGSLIKLAATIDQAMIDTMDNNINQHFPAAITNYYPQVGNELQVPQADKNDFYNQLQSIHAEMDMPTDDIIVVTNPKNMADVRRYQSQGGGNAVNEAFQFGPYTYFADNRVSNDAGVESTAYSFPYGAIGMQSRLDPDALNRSRIHESDYWDIFPNAPYVGMDLGVRYQAKCDDITNAKAAALTGLTASKFESWRFYVDVVYLTSYNSSPTDTFSPILKSEILQ